MTRSFRILERRVLVVQTIGLARGIDLLDAGNTRHVLLKDALDAHGQGQRAHGAACASALKLKLNDTLVVNADVLHIAAVSLQVGADLLKNLLKQLFVNSHRGSFLTITRASPRTELCYYSHVPAPAPAMHADTTFTTGQFGTCLYSFVNRVLRAISA